MIILVNYLKPDLSHALHNISTLGMAHVGDAVFELMVRTWLCARGVSTAKQLHGNSVEYVSAKAQAAASVRVIPALSKDELDVYKRGRNANVNSVPRSSTHEEYHRATGIEALFGYLYLKGETQRLDELFLLIIGDE
jgi:ribonuclease-3 family protein